MEGHYVIMCMHDSIVIVINDCNSGAQRQAEPVFLATPSCSVCSAMYGVARQGSAV